VEILLCRGSAQKIASPVRLRSGATDSGKKLQKNNIKLQKILNIIDDANPNYIHQQFKIPYLNI